MATQSIPQNTKISVSLYFPIVIVLHHSEKKLPKKTKWVVFFYWRWLLWSDPRRYTCQLLPDSTKPLVWVLNFNWKHWNLGTWVHRERECRSRILSFFAAVNEKAIESDRRCSCIIWHWRYSARFEFSYSIIITVWKLETEVVPCVSLEQVADVVFCR